VTVAEDEPDLTADEQHAYRTLPRTLDPPRALEDAVVSTLIASGAIASASRSRRGWMMPVFAAAMLVVAFAAGVRVGALRASRAAAPPVSGPTFMLLLYEGPAFDAPAPGREAERAREYGAWARGLDRGRLVAGDELAPRRVRLDAGAPTESPAGTTDVRGYFVIAARDLADATAIAGSCPHLRHGGTIIVREIVDR
jgi:hypothetical protein